MDSPRRSASAWSRLLLVGILASVLPGWGQSISVIMEPLGTADTQRVMGSSNNTLWRVYPSTTDIAATSIPRSAVTSITPISELPSKMAKDVLGKHAGANGLTLLGHGWDSAAPLIGDGLGFAGWALDSKEALYVAGGIKVVSLIRKLFVGQAPTPASYADDFLPELIPCNHGNCGEWYVLTEKLPNPQRQEIPATVAKSATVQPFVGGLLYVTPDPPLDVKQLPIGGLFSPLKSRLRFFNATGDPSSPRPLPDPLGATHDPGPRDQRGPVEYA